LTRNFRTNALARFLAIQPQTFTYRPEPPMTPDQIEAETERLNGLPKDEQVVIFCQAMGFGVRDYLMEKSRYMGEVVNDIDYLDLDGGL
jgi:hypothetical protein